MVRLPRTRRRRVRSELRTLPYDEGLTPGAEGRMPKNNALFSFSVPLGAEPKDPAPKSAVRACRSIRRRGSAPTSYEPPAPTLAVVPVPTGVVVVGPAVVVVGLGRCRPRHGQHH